MNCRQTRELVSAYSDQELTGRQMLEIGDHLRHCAACAREWREINEVRRILRSARFHSPAPGSEQRLIEQIMIPEEPAWSVLLSALLAPSVAAPQRPRGRRLAAALALSSVAVLCAAVPFAPQTWDSARGNAETMANLPAVGASVLPIPGTGWGSALLPALHLTSAAPSYSTATPPPSDPQPISSGDTGPLRDVTMVDYVQTSAAWDEYRANAAGSQ